MAGKKRNNMDDRNRYGIYGGLGNLEKIIREGIPEFSEEDNKVLKSFLNQMIVEGISMSRIAKYIYTLIPVRRRLGKPFKEVTEEDLRNLIVEIEMDHKLAAWTKHDYKVIIRKFFAFLGLDTSWIKAKIPKVGKLPEEILSEEEIKRMAEAACNSRDRAFVLMLYESGCRIGEFLPLKIKHIEFDEYGALLYVRGKTGERKIRLVASVVALQRWLEDHPDRNNPEAYLWCRIPTSTNPGTANKHINYHYVRKLLKELAKRAGIKKKVNPHAFRHARATILAKYLTEPQMREFHGWTKDSEMPSIYVHMSGRDIDYAILKIYGDKITKKDTKPKIRLIECPRCGEKNDTIAKYCYKCGLPLNKKYLYNSEAIENIIAEFLEAIARKYPEVKKIFSEIVKKNNAEEMFFDI